MREKSLFSWYARGVIKVLNEGEGEGKCSPLRFLRCTT